MTDITPVPAEISAAVNAVMTEIRPVGHDGTVEGKRKYGFASTDKFLSVLGPMCARAGLIILQGEEEFEVRIVKTLDAYTNSMKENSWLVMRFSFVLAHSSGATWGPVMRSIMVLANGPQAFGAAQSYALKQFMRCLFMVPTGEKDADELVDDPLPQRTAFNPVFRRTAPSPPSDPIPTEYAAIAPWLRKQIEASGETKNISNLMVKHAELLNTMPDGEGEAIRVEARARIASLKQGIATVTGGEVRSS